MNNSYRQSQAFFEARYATQEDPWQFASSPYELGRYEATIEALSKPRYQRGYEPGCSVGVLTAALCQRVDRLVACDISQAAVARARERCQACPNVEIHQSDVAAGPPAGSFELIVMSELGYYFNEERLAEIANQMAERLEPGGEFVAVHWLGHSPDHVLHGDAVHQVLAASLPCDWITGSRHAGFRIDSWRRAT